MADFKPIKIQVTKADGSVTDMTLPESGSFIMNPNELATVVSEHNITQMIKSPMGGPLVMVMDNGEEELIVMIESFFDAPGAGEATPHISVKAPNIDGVFSPQDFETTPTVAFPTESLSIPPEGLPLSEDDSPIITELGTEETRRVREQLFVQSDNEPPTFEPPPEPEIPPLIFVNDRVVLEGNRVLFTVSLSKASSQPVVVTYTTTDGTAIEGADYIGVSKTITFLPGELTKQVLVDTLLDGLDEPDETFFINLSSPIGGIIADPQGQGTILDFEEDIPPEVRITDAVPVVEGNQAMFQITLSAPSGFPIRVFFNTTDGTATLVNGDYIGIGGGFVDFAPGETLKTVVVQTLDDSDFESPENFFVDLTSATNATIIDPQGEGIILDNDRVIEPEVRVTDAVPVVEGNQLSFVITLSEPTTVPVRVFYKTADGTATLVDNDYIGIGAGFVDFAAGETSKTVLVQSNDNALLEPTENMFLELTASTNSVIVDPVAEGTILDDDKEVIPEVRITDAIPVVEGNQASFEITLSEPSTQAIRVFYRTSDGTARLVDNDYVGVGASFVDFAAGETAKTVLIQTIDNPGVEPTENFFVDLISSTNSVIVDPQGEGTILDDDRDVTPEVRISDAIPVVEGNQANFEITLSEPSSQPIRVFYRTNDGTASLVDGDYIGVGASFIDFAAGEISKTVTIQTIDNAGLEPTENFFVDLIASTNSVIIDPRGEGTILDDDRVIIPEVRITDAVPVFEGNQASFEITLSEPSNQPVRVFYRTGDGTATISNGDYTGIGAAFVDFAAGETSKTVVVQTLDDAFFEPTENFFVDLIGSTNSVIVSPQGEGTILDDDGNSPLEIRISDAVPVVEGNQASFVITLSTPSAVPVRVFFETADGTATVVGGDYTGIGADFVDFAAGEVSKTVLVQTLDDAVLEPTENFFVNLTGASSGAIVDPQGEGTILDDDREVIPEVRITDAIPVFEGNQASFEITLSEAATAPVRVFFSTSDGTATLVDGDYTGIGADFVDFAVGETAKTVLVQTLDDADVEATENFFVDLTAATNAVIVDPQGEGTILDDDRIVVPEVRISDAIPVVEGNQASFEITLSEAATAPVRVFFTTADGTATVVNGDYTGIGADFVDFAIGETAKTVVVQTLDDADIEPTENFFVDLTSATNAVIIDPRGEGTIYDDDQEPVIPEVRITDAVPVVEGNQASFEITLSAPTTIPVRVFFTTADGTATVVGGDYTGIGANFVDFAAGETSKTVLVQTLDDAVLEPTENFFVDLTAATNAVIADPRGEGTILDDDRTLIPEVRITDAVPVIEGSLARFEITLSEATTVPVRVFYTTADGTATVVDGDYTGIGADFVDFAVGETSKFVLVQTLDDAAFEPTENFFVDLTAATNAVIADPRGEGTIYDDDRAITPKVSISDAAPVIEGSQASFEISLSAPTTLPVRVFFNTADGTATVVGGDYVGVGPNFVDFAVGETSKTVLVQTLDDAAFEPTENFFVDLTFASNAVIIDPQGEGTILDDELPVTPEVRIGDADPVIEGNQACFEITLSAPTAFPVRVFFNTSDGTAAVADGDYTGIGASFVDFAAGETSKLVKVQTLDDSDIELLENLFVDLTAATNAVIVDPQGEGTIVDNDVSVIPEVRISDAFPVIEGGLASFEITLSAPSLVPVRVFYNSADGSASVVDGDYTGTGVNFVDFAAGETSKIVNVQTLDDGLAEPTENFFVDLIASTNSVIVDPRGEGLILDNELPVVPEVRISDAFPVIEGSQASFEITLSVPTAAPVRVFFNTADGTATVVDGDYTGIGPNFVDFAAGETSKTVLVQTLDDALPEPTENFFVDLTSATNAVIVDPQGEGLILDNELPVIPEVRIGDAAPVIEGNQASFDITLSVPTAAPVRVFFNTADGTATVVDGDYTGIGTNFVDFAAGETVKTVVVQTLDDAILEPTENFFVDLTGATNAVIVDPQGEGSIIDNDQPVTPQVRISDADPVIEGSQACFEISLSAPSLLPVRVFFNTADGTARVVDGDYTGIAPNFIDFAAGETSKTVKVQTLDDSDIEATENFFVDLTGATNAVIVDPQGEGIILDDELPVVPEVRISDADPVIEGNLASFEITLSVPTAAAVRVFFNTADGTATVIDGDYTGIGPNFVDFAAGETSKTVLVQTLDDVAQEPIENFFVDLTGATNAVIVDPQGEGTILDNDFPVTPQVRVSDADPVIEGSQASFEITLSVPSLVPVRVFFSTSDGVATVANGDYTGIGLDFVDFAAGETSKTVLVQTLDDANIESTENFFLDLIGVTNAVIVDPQGEGTILDNEVPVVPQVRISDADPVIEGSQASFEITLSVPTAAPVRVFFNTSDGTATVVDGDYTGIGPNFVDFAAGETSKTILVQTLDDAILEPIENFFVDLTGATNAVIVDPQGEGTIIDDDQPIIPEVRISDAAPVIEGSQASFEITLSVPSAVPVRVFFNTTDGTATVVDGDYTGIGPDFVDFAAGETSKTVVVQTLDDSNLELTENFFVDLTGADNAVIVSPRGEGVILDDENPVTPEVRIGDADPVIEGSQASFEITLSVPTALPVRVFFNTADGTATVVDGDYTGIGADFVDFAAGETSKTVVVQTLDDSDFEATENFFVDLTGATNAVIIDPRGEGLILDDENPVTPEVRISDADPVIEGSQASFEITLSVPTPVPVRVFFSTADGTATVVDGDYTGIGADFVDFAVGETSKTVLVQTLDDSDIEFTENFFVDLTAATNAVIVDPQGQGLILDNENPLTPEVRISDADPVIEGSQASFEITLSAPTALPVRVFFSTADGTATLVDGDYIGIGADFVDFAAGETSKTIQVQTLDDSDIELIENFFVDLTAATNAVIVDPQGEGTIIDNENPVTPEVRISDADPVIEGTQACFEITLSVPSLVPVRVFFSTADGTATVVDGDYTGIGADFVDFAAGETSKIIKVQTLDDSDIELLENFFVDLTAATNAVIVDPQGEATIIDNENPVIPEVRIGDADPVIEGSQASFEITLSVPSLVPVRVFFSTADGTATVVDGDYTGIGADFVDFAAGETSKTIQVQTLDDSDFEPTENFFVDLTGATNAVIVDPQGEGTIIDDDRPVNPRVDIHDATPVNEGGEACFEITLSEPTTVAVRVFFETNDGTAIAGADYDEINGAFVDFAPGETSKLVKVQTLDDSLDENVEDFFVNLTGVVNATLGDSEGLGQILDNDFPPKIKVLDADPVDEGGQACFTIILSEISGRDITVDFETMDGTATSALIDGDYVPITNGQITIPAGTLSVDVKVQTTDDNLNEDTENFFLNLTGADFADIIDSQGEGFILDNEVALPCITINNVEVVEGDQAVFTVALSFASGQTISVDFNTGDTTPVSAVAGADYDPETGTLTFNPGQTTATITVDTTVDNIFEMDEHYLVNLSNPSNAHILDGVGLGTIVNDDNTGGEPVAKLSGPKKVIEPSDAEGYVDITYTVTLSNPSSDEIKINYQTMDLPGGADAGDDYEATSGVLSFAPGVLEQTFTVRVLADKIDEDPERFKVTIDKEANSWVIIDPECDEVTTKIIDNPEDVPTVINISNGDPIKVEEPLTSDDFVEVEFIVSLSEASALEVIVHYETQDGGGPGDAASANDDYIPISGNITFAPGETSATLTVLVRGDSLEENLESFSIQLSSPVNATIGDDLGFASILDPDLQVGTNDDDVIHGHEGADVIIGDAGGITELNPSISITYVLDTSGSMDNHGRLSTLKEAVKNLNAELKSLVDQGANVDINLIEFNHASDTEYLGSFSITGQSSLDDLNDEIDDLDANGWTSYTEALYETNLLFDNGTTDPNDYDYTTVLFVSDGEPAGPVNPRYSHLISGNREDEPDTFDFIMNNQALLFSLFPFLLADNIVTRAVGVGDNINQDTLDLIDSTGTAIIVADADMDDLSEVIENVIFESLTPLGEDVLFGSDGTDVIYGDLLGDSTYNEILATMFGGDEQALLDFILNPENEYANARTLDNPDRGAADEIHGGAGDDVLFGEGGDDTIYGDAGNDLIFGGAGDDVIYGGEGNDTLYGDAGSDTIYGEAGDDVIMYQEGDIDALVDAGEGDDVLRFDNSSSMLDLRDPEFDGVYNNFEKVDLGGANNTLKINPNDVLDMTDNDNQLLVDGDASDKVEGDNWTASGVEVIGAKTYSVYTGAGDARLLVQDQINTTDL